MNNKILITTTNSVENSTIERYIEIISTNVVIGTNFFSDFGASLTDLFGGFSGTYQNKLQEINNIAIDTLKKKAKRLGANAIIGLKIDFDEISGKGKSMFMISALGTAVFIKHKEEKKDINIKTNRNDNSISFTDLNNEVTKLLLIDKIQSGKLPSVDEWTYLINNPIEEISEKLLMKYIEINPKYVDETSESQRLLFENFPILIQNTNRDFATNLLYNKIDGQSNLILEILKKNKLFDSRKISELITKGYLTDAIQCLKIDKEMYLESDISEMYELIRQLDKLPDLGKIETSKGLLSKSTEVFICPKGHKNNINDIFCQHQNRDFVLDCGLNIRELRKKKSKK
ncbi:MAG: YbjQ family protein [Paludibacteraceae bacterium]